ncbi:MAG TPA: acyltransferase family protein [Labilithrix sp.]|nr:acyltransferase family protein [Labilithrix sp.]
MHPATRTRVPHVRALDGLRGLALLGVLLFHSNKLLPGGYLGVDLFFVLSGYLITALLLAEHRMTGRIALAAFWVRRARRLLPALLALIPAVALYGWLFAKPDELSRIRGDALATLGYVANWRAIFAQKSYWELFATPSPLEHTWSLSIEEQFYVIWPVIVMFLCASDRTGRSSKRRLFVLTLTLAALSMVAMRVLFDPAKTSRVYLGTDTRMAGILAGAALATLIPPSTTFEAKTIRKLDALGIVAALGLGVAWWKLEGENPFLYKGGLWLTEFAALVLIVCAVSGDESIVARALAFRPLTLLGTISYGLYLWHWPVNVFFSAPRFDIGGWIRPVQFSVAFAVAIASYRFLERPIRTRGLPFGRPIVVVPAVVSLSVLLVVGATYPRRTSSDRSGASPSPALFELAATTSEPSFKVLLVGDSTANSLGWAIRGIRKQGVVVELMGKDGCTMLSDTCEGEHWAARTKALQPHATLFFVGGAFMHGISARDGQWVKACHAAWDDAFRTTVAKRLADLLAPTTRVFALTIPYGVGPSWGGDDFRREVDCINANIREAAAAVPTVEILDLAGRLCPAGVCERQSEGVPIRADGVHYEIAGARVLSGWVFDQLLTDPPRAGASTTSGREARQLD